MGAERLGLSRRTEHMDIPLRRILRVFYPGRFSAADRKGNRAGFSWKRFFFILSAALMLLKAGLFLFYYNTFLSLQYDVEEAGAQIDTQLQRRKNIILNLNAMVMDYAEHEKEIFKHAADTRAQMLASGSGDESPRPKPGKMMPKMKKTEGPEAAPRKIPPRREAGPVPDLAADLDALLSKIFAVAERYPDLRLSESFQHFMDALVDAENRIAQERMSYNKRVNDMSTIVGKFPGFIFAKVYGFEAPPFFEPEAVARRPPNVELGREGP